jgi:hypothetical protein
MQNAGGGPTIRLPAVNFHRTLYPSLFRGAPWFVNSFGAYLLAYGPAVVIIALCIPTVLGKVPPNGIYGFRTPKTLSSPAIRYPANRMSGWFLIIASAVAVLCNSAVLIYGFEGTEFAWLGINLFALRLVAALASFAYLRRDLI